MSLRADLLAAATTLLDDGGPDQVTLREVGRRTGVSRTAPYRHFRSKADLLATVAATELRDLHDEVLRLDTGTAPATDVLRAAMLAYVGWARRRPERFRLVFGPWREENDELLDAAERANRWLVDLVVRAQDDGALAPGDPWNAAAAIRSFAHGAAVLEQNGHLLGQGRRPLDAGRLVEGFLVPDGGGVLRFASGADPDERL
jgi:AcrR family transcriptional regulator